MTPLRPKVIVFQKYEFFSYQIGQNRFFVESLDFAADRATSRTRRQIISGSQARPCRRTWHIQFVKKGGQRVPLDAFLARWNILAPFFDVKNTISHNFRFRLKFGRSDSKSLLLGWISILDWNFVFEKSPHYESSEWRRYAQKCFHGCVWGIFWKHLAKTDFLKVPPKCLS